MYIRDIRKEFFDELEGRLLVMCALDVDAICACKLLQFILESYNLQYSVAPVASTDDFCRSFEEYRSSVDSIIIINFGNLINIPRLLKPSPDIKFFVIDSHRPINVYNFYKHKQVRLFINSKKEQDLNIPRSEKIFIKGDDGMEEKDEENLALLTADARELTNEQLENRRKLREWLLRKQKILFDYEEYHYYNRSVAVIMYDLAVEMSKNNNYLLWLAIVGLTYQLRSEKISSEKFEEEAELIMRHISRNTVSGNHARGNTWKIVWQKDLLIELYRRWTVFESLHHSPLIVCRFQLYHDKGARNLSEFLVQCGQKLDACKTEYPSMPLSFRTSLIDNMEKVCLGDLQDKYNVQELITRSFVLHCDIRKPLCANDFVLALRALLEYHNPKTKVTKKERFVRAIKSLSYGEFDSIELGCREAQLQLKSMFAQVKTLITTLKIIDAGMFLYVDLSDYSAISRDFAQGDSLVAFARFLLSAYVSSLATRVAKRASRLSLILFCPDYEKEGEVIVVGIPPVAQQTKRNLFFKAFEQAALDVDCEIRPDLSETNLVRIDAENKHRLLEQLKVLLG